MTGNIEGKWEPLGPHAKVFVTREHRFNTDTILLANFSSPRRKDTCADFGTGCGTIPLLWHSRFSPAEIYAVELQEQAAYQAELSFLECHADIKLIKDDIRNYRRIFQSGSLDLIACNPPYKALGTGIRNENSDMKIARHEENLSLEDLAEAAEYSLRYGGRLCICQRPERLTDALCIFRAHRLEPKRLRLVQARPGREPSLFLLECRRGGGNGLDVLPTLFLEENGTVSPEMLEIYGDYKTR